MGGACAGMMAGIQAAKQNGRAKALKFVDKHPTQCKPHGNAVGDSEWYFRRHAAENELVNTVFVTKREEKNWEGLLFECPAEPAPK